MGQGMLTGLAMLVAEELEVDLSAVRTEFAPAGPAYINPLLGEQGTGGSTAVLHPSSGRRLDYGALAALPAPTQAILKPPRLSASSASRTPCWMRRSRSPAVLSSAWMCKCLECT
ncbi:MAG: hypothetical protein AB1790_14375 [Pseudomonadota bacterium]